MVRRTSDIVFHQRMHFVKNRQAKNWNNKKTLTTTKPKQIKKPSHTISHYISFWSTRTACKPVKQLHFQLFCQQKEKNEYPQLCHQELVDEAAGEVERKGKLTHLKPSWPSKPESCSMGSFTTKPWMIQKAFKDRLWLVLLVHEHVLLLGSDVASMLQVMNCTDCKHSWESSSAIPNCFLSLAYFIIWFFYWQEKNKELH